jgi:hypothetical protein
VREIAASLPWLVPGSLVALVVSILASRRAGGWLRIDRALAAFLLFSLGIILVGTLTPIAADEVVPPELRDACDFSRTSLATPADLASGGDVVINILMFMPFGFALGSIRWTWRKVAIILAAIVLPFAIETVQLAVLELGRGCQAADVVDNLTGLLVGVCAGIPVSWWPRPPR